MKTTSIRICKQCGARYERLISFMKKRNPRFCSVACARQAQLGKSKKPNGERAPERPCESCQKPFRPLGGNAGRFCSRPCTFRGMRGTNAANWGGGRHIDPQGYVWLRMQTHPRKKVGGYVREHIVVMERILGRYLTKIETVHHINGKRDDNRPDNLQLCHGKHGKGTAMVCFDCGSINVGHTPIVRNVNAVS